MDYRRLSYHFSCIPDFKPTFRKYEKLVNALHRRKNQKHFLEECLQEQVVPKMYGLTRWTTQSQPFPESSRLFLQERIEVTKQEIFVLRRKISDTSGSLRALSLNDEWYQCLTRWTLDRVIYSSEIHKCNLMRKIKMLISRSVWNNLVTHNNVMNLSSQPLTEDQHRVLNLGLSFAMKPDNKNSLDFLVGFDKFFANNNFDRGGEICLKGILLNVLEEYNNNKNPLPRRFLAAIASIKDLKNTIVTRSDKDGKIVLLDKELYIHRAMDLLNDEDTYEKLTKNPLNNVAAEFYRQARKIGGNKKDIEMIEKLKVINPSLPYFYGLPKTHKDGIPLRPIVSCRGSFTYKLSKWLADQFSPFLGVFSSSHLKHSEDFIQKFQQAHIPTKNIKLLSLDVDSLFTKVPVNDVLNFLSEKLTPYADHFPLGIEKTIRLVNLCISNNIFSFNGNYYKQKFGCSMGSPLSPLLANLYMEFFETELLPTIKPQGMTWLRYVDDIFTFWDEKWGNFDVFFRKLNELVPSIKFKTEWEVEKKIPFLDVLIMREAGGYSFTVYRKPTFSISYIHYFSYHDISIKTGVACNLFLRALRVCSPGHLEGEMRIIREHLSELYYPLYVVEKALRKANSIYHVGASGGRERDTDFKNKIKIPYVKSVKDLSQNLGDKNPFVFSYPRTIGTSILNVYQSNKMREGGIYSIPCQSCNSKYVGQTGKPLTKRIDEHKRSVRYAQESSAVFVHMRDKGHQVKWEDASFIHKTACPYKRKILESHYIEVNDTFNLSAGQWKPDMIDRMLIADHLQKHKPPDST